MINWARIPVSLRKRDFSVALVVADEDCDSNDFDEECEEQDSDTAASHAFDQDDDPDRVVGATLFRNDGGTFKVTVYGKDGVPVYCERLERLNIGIDEEDIPVES